MAGRRQVLRVIGCAPAVLLAGGQAFALTRASRDAPRQKPAQPAEKEQENEEVGPVEDLMREHGVLRRIFGVYREIGNRLQNRRDVPSGVPTFAALLIRQFIEDYHERLEEERVFPRFKKGHPLKGLVDVLATQHARGRELTDAIVGLGDASLKNDSDRVTLRDLLTAFLQMYEAHAAREDTVLFPAFHRMLPAKEYDALGDYFEEQERQLFGEGGFEKNVEAVAALEKKLGIYDLSRLTPEIRG